MAATIPLNLPRNTFALAALAALVLGPARSGAAFSFGRPNDVWDVSQGATVTNTSGVLAVSSANDMFGGSDSTVETGTTLFRDDQDAGFVHFVEWHTPAPVTIQAFNLYANDDGSSGDRGFTTFRLFVKNTNTSMFDQVYSAAVPSNPYPDNNIELHATITPVVGQDFRAEFVQFANTSTPARGPRIRELDAGTAPFGDEDDGFIPPDKHALKCESAVAKLVGKLLATSAACASKTAKAAIKGKTFDEAVCEDAAQAKYAAAVDKLKDCPQCIEDNDLHAIATDEVDTQIPAIFCAGATTFGSHGAFVPPDKATAKCADGVTKSWAKRATSQLACHIKLAKAAFAAKKPFDEEACEDKAQGKYDKAQAKRVGCPPCLDAAAVSDATRGNLDDENGGFYCAF